LWYGDYGITGWFPITIFKQTSIVEISGSITGSQSISSGIPSMLLFAPDGISHRQNFVFEFYGDSTFVGNNRDIVFSVLAMTWDLVTPMTSSVLFSTGTIRFNTLTNQTWRFNGQINPVTTGSACRLLGHGQFIQFTATNNNTPFGLSGDVTIDNSKPIRFALVAGWVAGNTTNDKIRCKNGYIQIQ
jgi:hypothetical protein